MAKGRGSDEGFREIFKREMGFSHPRSISRRISASEVLVFLLTALEYSSMLISLSLGSFYVISIRKSCHFSGFVENDLESTQCL